ncbi:MAG: hypothetical protein HFG70_13205 [Hungatella sp.]|nr:hypothetical protein [Hungatella sp.]
MTENEIILALRNELEPIKEKLRDNENALHDFRLYVENEIETKINILAENYMPAAKRYERSMPETNEMKQDINIIKKVIEEHSESINDIKMILEKLQKIS